MWYCGSTTWVYSGLNIAPIFVNDLSEAFNNSDGNLVADDSMIHCDGIDYMEVQVKVLTKTANIEQW